MKQIKICLGKNKEHAGTIWVDSIYDPPTFKDAIEGIFKGEIVCICRNKRNLKFVVEEYP